VYWGFVELGQLITIVMMAVALGMDAFSMGIGMGLRGIRLVNIAKVSFVIGLFHILMPLMGMFMGNYVSSLLGNVATTAGGALLVVLGAHMLYSALRGSSSVVLDQKSFWGILLFALMVSIDSFSVGLSLGMFSSDIALTVLIFGFFGGLMSVLGLLLGRRVGAWVGEYGEALGGLILLLFGIRFLM
jgi:manganese efflux pump family protein